MIETPRQSAGIRLWLAGLTNGARYGSVLTIFLSYFGQSGQPWAKWAGVQLFAWGVLAALQDSYLAPSCWQWLAAQGAAGLVVFSVGLTVHNTGWYWILYLVLVIQTAAIRKTRDAAVVTGLLFLLRVANLEASPWPWPSQIFIQSLLTTVWLFMLLLAAGLVMADQAAEKIRLEELARKLDSSHRELARAYTQLSESSRRAEEASVLRERARIAREIHDSLGHTMVGLMVQLEAASRTLERDVAKADVHLQHALGLAKQGTVEVRHAIKALRPPLLIPGQWLLAVDRLVDDFAIFSGVRVELRLPAEEFGLDEEVEVAVYRGIQEGLTNAFNHGRATRVLIQVRQSGRWLFVRIRDNGQGSRNLAAGFGLSAMRERVQTLGGRMRVRNATGGGFVIAWCVPVQQDGEERWNTAWERRDSACRNLSG
ncbi:MAG: sensor histidine kinase [Thermaerobacter sp.]|nr:sensor histidine kinase [Thermaerobacter sp.]